MRKAINTIQKKWKQNKGIQLFLHFSRHINDCSLSAHAGQTAFFFMLSFFPFMLFLFALLRLTPLSEEGFTSYILYIIPASFRDFIGKLIHNIYTASNTKVLSISIFSAIWLGSKSFLSLVQGLNSMYQQKESRNYIILRLFAFLDSILFAILLLITLTFLVFGNWLHQNLAAFFPAATSVITYFIDFRMLIGFFILFLIFLLMYYFLPNCKWKIRHHVPGAFLASLGWLLFSYLYSFYVDYFSNYSSFYGTMTTIALLMVWLYACMYLLFFGGVLNDCLKRHITARKSNTP